MKNLFILIGMPKTGSTSVRNFLFENKKKIENHYIFDKNHKYGVTSNFFFDDHNFTYFQSKIKNENFKNFILVDENFFRKKILKNFLDKLDTSEIKITFIICKRKLSEFLKKQWFEINSKFRNDRRENFKDYLKKNELLENLKFIYDLKNKYTFISFTYKKNILKTYLQVLEITINDRQEEKHLHETKKNISYYFLINLINRKKHLFFLKYFMILNNYSFIDRWLIKWMDGQILKYFKKNKKLFNYYYSI